MRAEPQGLEIERVGALNYWRIKRAALTQLQSLV